MLSDRSDEMTEVAGTWAAEERQHDWREVDEVLRRLAEDRARLDAEEAKWLRIADKLQIWREVGCASFLEYLERRLGYTPHTAKERLRVALALEKLSVLADCLKNGELPFSAAKELTRVTTPETEGAWLEAAKDKSVHEIEVLVAGHKEGDLPTDAPDPELEMKILRYKVKLATAAMERQARAALEKRRGERVDEDQFIAAAYAALIAQDEAKAEATSARFQIALTVCEKCDRGWQQSAGAQVPVDAATVARAKCDAQFIGSIDGGEPARAKQSVPPRVRRFVRARDGGKCTLAWCRAAANLEIHHIVAREDGGTNEAKNLMLLCDGHHTHVHEGLLTIKGEAPDKLVVEQLHDVQSHVGLTKKTRLDEATLQVRARAELVKRGYSKRDAAKAVGLAQSHVGLNVALDLLVREAIRRSPRTD